MINTATYILISTIMSSNAAIVQSTATFADKQSCESAATRQDFVLKALETHYTKWNLTCHPYQIAGEKK